jgi:hypothetical protein
MFTLTVADRQYPAVARSTCLPAASGEGAHSLLTSNLHRGYGRSTTMPRWITMQPVISVAFMIVDSFRQYLA